MLLFQDISLSQALSFSFWSTIWSTYALMDPAYQDCTSWGFWIDTGNGELGIVGLICSEHTDTDLKCALLRRIHNAHPNISHSCGNDLGHHAAQNSGAAGLCSSLPRCHRACCKRFSIQLILYCCRVLWNGYLLLPVFVQRALCGSTHLKQAYCCAVQYVLDARARYCHVGLL